MRELAIDPIKRDDLIRLFISLMHVLGVEKEIFSKLEKRLRPYEFEHKH